jgi:hypothetical protein
MHFSRLTTGYPQSYPQIQWMLTRVNTGVQTAEEGDFVEAIIAPSNSLGWRVEMPKITPKLQGAKSVFHHTSRWMANLAASYLLHRRCGVGV